MLARMGQAVFITLGLYLLVSLNASALSRPSVLGVAEELTLASPTRAMVAKVRSQLAP